MCGPSVTTGSVSVTRVRTAWRRPRLRRSSCRSVIASGPTALSRPGTAGALPAPSLPRDQPVRTPGRCCGYGRNIAPTFATTGASGGDGLGRAAVGESDAVAVEAGQAGPEEI